MIENGRYRHDERNVKLPLKSFLDYFKVEQAEETATESEPQGDGAFRLVDEGRIVELEFGQVEKG